MNKTEYLKKLTDELGHMPYGDVKDIIQSMEEHFEEGINEGRSEEEIAESLGDPKELAMEFKDGAKFKQIMKKRRMSDNFKGPDGRGRIFVIIFNAFVGIEMWLILLAAIIAAFMFLAGDCAFIGLIIAGLVTGTLIEYLLPFIFEFPIYLEGRGWVYPDMGERLSADVREHRQHDAGQRLLWPV